MKTWTRAVLGMALLAGPILASDGAETVDLRLESKAGTRVVHAFVLDRSLVAQKLVTRSGGEEQGSQDEIELGGRTTWKFTDEIREVRGARATLFRRVLDDGRVHVDMRRSAGGTAVRPITLDGGSPLVGAGVLFRWIESRAEYGRLYDGIETSEEFLPRLEAEVGLGFLLPRESVSIGGRWDVDPKRVRELFAFGGLVPIRFAKGSDPLLARTTSFGVAGPLHAALGTEVSGRIAAELVAVDAGVARIEIEFELRSAADQTARNAEGLTPLERYDGVVVERANSTWTFRGEGELRWNVARRCAERLSVSGAETVRLELVLSGPTGPGGSDFELAGGLKLSIDTVVSDVVPGPR